MNALIKNLITVGVLRTPHIIEAFSAVDRKDFVLSEYEKFAYEDYPLPIGYEQTISQPYTVAFMLELLQPKLGEKILDVGSGSAWTTALLAHIVGREGRVHGTEVIPELVSFGQQNLAKYTYSQAQISQAQKELGLPQKAPFNKILVSVGSEAVPKQLLDQLKVGGIMVIPIREDILCIQKTSESEMNTQKFEGFAFVPLIQ